MPIADSMNIFFSKFPYLVHWEIWGSHALTMKKIKLYNLPRCDFMQSGRSWQTLLSSGSTSKLSCEQRECSSLYIEKSYTTFEDLLASYFLIVPCLPQFSTLKTETVYSSETSVNLYWNLWRQLLEDSAFYTHRCEKRTFIMKIVVAFRDITQNNLAYYYRRFGRFSC
jgi:hypothetical protein